jgi:hypothetical protein
LHRYDRSRYRCLVKLASKLVTTRRWHFDRSIALPLAALALLGLGLACSSGTPEAEGPAQPDPSEGDDDDEPAGDGEPEAVSTGRDCLSASAYCEGGMCTWDFDNKCKAAVTCEVAMMAVCQGSTDRGEARGTGRGTIPAGSKDKIEAAANCEGASVMATQVESISCQ